MNRLVKVETDGSKKTAEFRCDTCGEESFIPGWQDDDNPLDYSDCDACEMLSHREEEGHCCECGLELDKETQTHGSTEGRDARRCNSCYLKSWDMVIGELTRLGQELFGGSDEE
jgi:hypothetical protein